MSVAVHHEDSEVIHHVEATPVALKGSSAGLRAEWFVMKSLKKLPSDAAFHGATPVLVNTVPNLDYASTEKEFATSGMKADFAAQFEGYVLPVFAQVVCVTLLLQFHRH